MKSWFEVSTTQMFIFVLFVSAGISFNDNFSLLAFPCPRKQLAMAWTDYEKFMI